MKLILGILNLKGFVNGCTRKYAGDTDIYKFIYGNSSGFSKQ